MDSLASNAFKQILIMFLIILIGVMCYKKKIVNKDTNKALSDLVLMLVNPLVIFISYQREFDSKLVNGLMISMVLAILTHIFGIVCSHLFVRGKKRGDNIAIERFAVIYSNCGFIGIPLVNGIVGSEGVFYLTAYMTIFNLFVWTHGVILITGAKDKKTFIKAILSPSVIATLTGFIFFMARIKVPEIPLETLSYVGNMNTPLAMLVAGVTIAQTNILRLITNLRVYYLAALKLVFVPVVMLLVFSLFNIPRIVLLTSVLAAGCPVAASINLFSIRYGKNYLYASEIFAVTTILSVLSIPIVMTLAELLV
ncbi:MAG TPA: AEC family transporter [Mobilitalea sp.]|nr:AEC family transporter [Mobilitalea sp.]